MEIIYTVAAGVGIGIGALFDGYKRLLPWLLIIAYMVAGIGLRIYDGTILEANRLYSLIPGIILILYAYISGESVGYGDGFMIMGLGMYMNLLELGAVLMLSVTLSGLVALILLVVFKKGKHFELPFIPFLFLGYILVRCVT